MPPHLFNSHDIFIPKQHEESLFGKEAPRNSDAERVTIADRVLQAFLSHEDIEGFFFFRPKDGF
jgi:hypothetical protein